MEAISTADLKRLNRCKVYQCIYESRGISKQQIVEQLGIGLSTVSQNLTALEAEGLIDRSGAFESTGGRKAQLIRIVPKARIAIGLGLLKDMVHLVAVDLYGQTLAAETVALPYAPSAAYYDALAREVNAFLARQENRHVLGVSIATQGLVSPDGSQVTYGAIMQNAHMRLDDFSSRLPYPCRLVHDSKAAAFLEKWNHPQLEDALVVLLNRNLGGALWLGGRIHRGSGTHGGSIEHMCINPDGPLCYCGQRGCLETYCSANALEQAAGMPLKAFFTLLRQGQGGEPLWERYLNDLAFAIRNLSVVFDTPVILSGYLTSYLVQADLDALLERINRTTPFPLDRLLMGAHGQYTPAIGAAMHDVDAFVRTLG